MWRVKACRRVPLAVSVCLPRLAGVSPSSGWRFLLVRSVSFSC